MPIGHPRSTGTLVANTPPLGRRTAAPFFFRETQARSGRAAQTFGARLMAILTNQFAKMPAGAGCDAPRFTPRFGAGFRTRNGRVKQHIIGILKTGAVVTQGKL